MQIEARVKRVIGLQLGLTPGSIDSSENLTKGLGADSLDLVEIVMALEDEFLIEITDEEAYTWTTVQSVIDYITGQVEKK